MELQLEPRPDDQTDRTRAHLPRQTRQVKTDGQARINLGRANSDSDRNFSLLARLARTAFTGDRTDDLASLFDSMMDFSFGYFSKARILKLSEDLGHAGTQLVRSERPAALTDRPALVVEEKACWLRRNPAFEVVKTDSKPKISYLSLLRNSLLFAWNCPLGFFDLFFLEP
ncbi:hypothetical protein F2Q69_00013676 [Brassica cretica]|uniref:Uncharacterized protein n=1 Tax=Brassica cretica TaxID=69181 RepID=A0A8S9QR70_BRACR|nr:hypothetical protein F2Q69_00013676 [Brassica cretica]